jgi:hypothetical protein
MTEVLVGWVGIVIVSSFVMSIHVIVCVWFGAWSSGRVRFCMLELGARGMERRSGADSRSDKGNEFWSLVRGHDVDRHQVFG